MCTAVLKSFLSLAADDRAHGHLLPRVSTHDEGSQAHDLGSVSESHVMDQQMVVLFNYIIQLCIHPGVQSNWSKAWHHSL